MQLPGRQSPDLVWDNHGCMPLRPDDESFLPQLKRYRDAGVTVVALNVGFDATSFDTDVRMLTFFRRWLMERSSEYVLVLNVEDIDRARREQKLGVFFDIEGAAVVGDQLSRVALLYDLGVRWMSVAYNVNNLVGGGCQDEDAGLTRFGRTVIDEMERVGMIVCCSHTGLRTAREVMDHAQNPVIFSHSNPGAVHQHPRNIPDDVMRACAATGGVVGINGIGLFLGGNDATTANFLRHVDHAVRTIGPEHVGLGLDYVFDQQELADSAAARPEIFPPDSGYGGGVQIVSPEQIPEIANGLVTLGYSSMDIENILGRNWLRVAARVWK